MDDGTAEYHIPVLLEEAVSRLITDPDGVYVDGTLGGGGHSKEILRRLGSKGRLIGFDQDADAIRHSSELFANDGRMTIVHNNVVYLQSDLQSFDVLLIDGILLDLGISSHQVDEPERGFSFRFDGPLDMRMNNAQTSTAADIIQNATADDLAGIFFAYGEERRSRSIAKAIVTARGKETIRSTGQLTEIINRCTPFQHRSKTLARIFQALRIAVNSELDVLETILEDSFEMLRTGGRMVVISYHSLEDRIVKHFFRHEARYCICPPHIPVCICGKVQRAQILTNKQVPPDDDEIRRNPRARSGRLRACEKIHA